MNTADAVLIHFRRMKRITGISATVQRGETTFPATIVLDRTDEIAVTTREAAYSADTQDILIELADYAVDSKEPQAEDRFQFEIAGQTVVAEARANDSQPCFHRWPGGGVFCVHTKIRSRT